MDQHALLSASGAHRWLNCPPSARLEENFPEESSIYANEGTAAHALAEFKINEYLGNPGIRPVSEFDSEEFESFVDIYVNYSIELIENLRKICGDPAVLVEQKLDYSNFAPEGFGTGDLVMYTGDTIFIVDLKFGKGVKVFAENNPQMKLYGLGALKMFDRKGDITTIKMIIVQPRLDHISTFETSSKSLFEWANNELKSKAELAFAGLGEFKSGGHCKFCKARFTCRARAEENLRLAEYEFQDPQLLSDEEIPKILLQSQKLAKWAQDVENYALDLALKGKNLASFKLAEGRSLRKWKNESEVAENCEILGLKNYFKNSLKSVAEIEKEIGKEKFNKNFGELVEKTQGKLRLEAITDENIL